MEAGVAQDRADRRTASQATSDASTEATELGMALKKWTPDAPYISRMKAADAESLYAVYLDEKPDYANSTAFHLDVADMLFDKGRRDLALRVLSNLAEMDLENRHVLRILGYRLMQAGAPGLAVPVFEEVERIAEEEPQSFRDLGLAYAAIGRFQDAIDQLNEVVVRTWDARFSEVELITLADLNAIVATAKAKSVAIDTSRIDPRLLKNMPLDLRAVLTWDADNSDMDLWVTDPNGERCYYGNRFTWQGGRLSRDATGGYGPEEFSLRFAKPGKYKVEANFFGHRQQVVAGATTLQLILTTKFGTRDAKEQMVTLRLRGNGETVFVGEFEVKAR
jgi:tetratricopeptide (TPR) repeat protein